MQSGEERLRSPSVSSELHNEETDQMKKKERTLQQDPGSRTSRNTLWFWSTAPAGTHRLQQRGRGRLHGKLTSPKVGSTFLT